MARTGTPLSAPFEWPTAASAPLRGRGAVRNVRHRFEQNERVRFSDEALIDSSGRAESLSPEASLPVLRTSVTSERARTLISRNDSPDIPFDRAVNPYRGCEHGCVYCYARPTHAYLG